MGLCVRLAFACCCCRGNIPRLLLGDGRQVGAELMALISGMEANPDQQAKKPHVSSKPQEFTHMVEFPEAWCCLLRRAPS